jgi:hypothetical protein
MTHDPRLVIAVSCACLTDPPVVRFVERLVGQRDLPVHARGVHAQHMGLLAGVCVGFGLSLPTPRPGPHSPVVFCDAKVATKYLICDELFIEIRSLRNR